MMMPDRRRIMGIAACLAVLLGIGVPPARAYVLMGEHILELTVKAMGKADAFEVAQTVTIHAPQPAPAASLAETVRIRGPYDVRVDAVGDGFERHLLFSGHTALMAVNGVLQEGPPPRYLRYHEILMTRPRQALTDYLRVLGVDVQVSSLGRLEDRYCYVVGARFPNEDPAQLWVDKDTFLPFRLLLPAAGIQPEAGPVEIRYRNWTFTDGAAYPMHIVMRQGHQVMEEIRVDRVRVNPVFSGELFDMAALRREWSRPTAPAEESGRPAPPSVLPSVSE